MRNFHVFCLVILQVGTAIF